MADVYIEALAARAGHLPVGNPNTEEVAIGPLIEPGAVERVAGLVDQAKGAGAEVVAGGGARTPYFPLTVLRNVDPERL